MKILMDLAEMFVSDVSIYLSGSDIRMAEKHLNGAKVRAVLQ